jgi:hypothetical protein
MILGGEMGEIEIREIVNSQVALNRLFECHPKKAKDTFRLARIRRELMPILTDYQDARIALLEKHGVPDGSRPGFYKFVKVDADGEPLLDDDKKEIKDDAAGKAFSDEHDELLGELVTVEQYVTLSFIERSGLDPTMTPTEMASLWWLIDELRDEEKASGVASE